MGAYDCDCTNNLEYEWRERKAQLSKKDTTKGATSDLISRMETVEHLRRVLDATVPNTDYDEGYIDGIEFGISTVSTMPTIQSQSTTGQLNDGVRSTARSTDLIDRQQTLDALIGAVKKVGILDADDIKAVFDMLPTAQPEPQWIPVSERLPEKGGEYLVSVRWYREDDIDIDVYDYDARCKEWNDGESCGQRVIAWMPLPKPFEGGVK